MAIDLYELALRFKSEGFTAVAKDLDKVDAKGKSLQKAFNALKATMIATAAIGFAKKILDETAAAQKATAQLNAVLQSTGGIAGVSADEIDKMSAALQRTSVFGDDAIKSASALLLTFTNIRGEVFTNTVPAIVDLATAMGSDLNTAAVQVGKALNDPIKGVTALQKVGVSFTASQRAVIKSLVETNRVADAQKIILKELQTEFGGSAEAARNTLGGALQGLSNAWGDLFEATDDSTKGMVDAINSLADNLPAISAKMSSFFGLLKEGFTGLKIGYLQDAADIQKAWSLLFKASALFTANESLRAAKLEQARIADQFVADTERRIADMKRRLGVGPFGDVTSGASTGTPPKKPTAPVGGGTGKDKTIKIPNPNIDFDSVSQANIDKIGQNVSIPGIPNFDPDKVPLPGVGMSIDDLDELLKKGRNKVASDAQILHERMAGTFPDQAQFEHEAAQAFEEYKESIIKQMEGMGVTIQQGLSQTIGDALFNGFTAAFNGEGIGGIIKEFGKTVLAGVGNLLTQLGQTWISYGVLMTGLGQALWNPFTSGPAAIAIGAGLIALGAALGAVAHGTGRGTAQAGAFREPRGTSDAVRLKFVDRPNMLSNLSPVQPVVINAYGPNDPKTQRWMLETFNNANRRRG